MHVIKVTPREARIILDLLSEAYKGTEEHHPELKGVVEALEEIARHHKGTTL